MDILQKSTGNFLSFKPVCIAATIANLHGAPIYQYSGHNNLDNNVATLIIISPVVIYFLWLWGNYSVTYDELKISKAGQTKFTV